jgi:hypothetical protein
MIKFVHKNHIHEAKRTGKITIYYNVPDIILGICLMSLVVFFIHDYLSHALSTSDCSSYVPQASPIRPGSVKMPGKLPGSL